MTQDEDRHYPIGFVSGWREIRNDFAEEAELIGVLTISWNRMELRLRDGFIRMMGDQGAFAAAIWDAQNTHQGRSRLLSLALETVHLSDDLASLLGTILDETKRLSELRNTLTHSEYLVHSETQELTARKPRAKQPTYQSSSVTDLEKIVTDVGDLTELIGAFAWLLIPQAARDELTSSVQATLAAMVPKRSDPEEVL